MKDLQWFLDRVGSFVMRGTTKIPVTDDKVAKKLFEIQSKDYIFSET